MCPGANYRRNLIVTCQTILALTCVCTSSAHALEWLSVQVPAPYESPASIPDYIVKDCIGLEKTVGIEVAYQLEKSGFARIDHIERVNLKAPGKLLALSIMQADASASQRTDPKSLTVKAELFQDGKSFEWITKSRTSRTDMEVCETMEKNAVAIAGDIYKWLITTLHSKTLPADLINDMNSSVDKVRQLQARTLWINSKVSYMDSVDPDTVNDCRIEDALIEQVQTVFSKTISTRKFVSTDNPSADEDKLQFTIVSIKGRTDDSSATRRGMTLKAELLRNGVVIDTFNGIHTSERGGVFGQVVRNTCDALNNISGIMANDTYQWYINRGTSTALQATIPADANSK